MCERLYRSVSHIEHLDDRLRKAYHIHGDGYSVGEGEDEADGASKLRPQAPGDQVVRSSWTTVTHNIDLNLNYHSNY